MRCEEVRDALEELRAEELSPAVRAHLASCAACERYAEDWRLARAGLRALAREPLPEATLGFAARLARRLEETRELGRWGADFLEQAGRRFVYATLLVTLMVMLALLLPPSGPLGASEADLYPAVGEAVPPTADPIFADDSRDPAPAAPITSTEGGQKKQR